MYTSGECLLFDSGSCDFYGIGKQGQLHNFYKCVSSVIFRCGSNTEYDSNVSRLHVALEESCVKSGAIFTEDSYLLGQIPY